MGLMSPLMQLFMMSESQNNATNASRPVNSLGIGESSTAQRKSIGNSKMSKREKITRFAARQAAKNRMKKGKKRGFGNIIKDKIKDEKEEDQQ